MTRTECRDVLSEELRKCGAVHQMTTYDTRQSNGRAERLNRTLMEKTRAMLFDAKIPKMFWDDAVLAAKHVAMRPIRRS